MSAFTLPIDKTASKASHQVPGEIHVITGSSVRVIIPHGGAFYTKDFYLGNPENTSQLLELGVDYGFEGFDPDLFTLTGFEVATAVWIKNPALNKVTIDYRRVGGRIGSNTALIHQLREAIQHLEADGVSWDSIRNKPETYPVEDHNHSIITDLTELEELRNQFEKLTEALISQRPLRDSGLQLRDSLDRLFGIVHDVRVDLNKQSTTAFNALEQEVIKVINDTISGLSLDGGGALIQDHESKESGAHVASAVDFSETGGGSTNLQDKIVSITSAINALNQTNDDQDSDITNLGSLVSDLGDVVNSFSGSITNLENSLQALSDDYNGHLDSSTTSHPSSAISHSGTSLSAFLSSLSNSVSSSYSALSEHMDGTGNKHSSSDITHGTDTVGETLDSFASHISEDDGAHASTAISHGDSTVGVELDDKVSMKATNLGKVGDTTANETPETIEEWADLPVGWSGLLGKDSYGLPDNSYYYYFTKLANRGTEGGWCGLLVRLNGAGERYIIETAKSTVDFSTTELLTKGDYGLGQRINLGLNDLNDYKTDGRYYQGSTNNATAARNYPNKQAGILDVDTTGNIVIQTYTTYADHVKYIRYFSNSSWRSWSELVTMENLSADVVKYGTNSNVKAALDDTVSTTATQLGTLPGQGTITELTTEKQWSDLPAGWCGFVGGNSLHRPEDDSASSGSIWYFTKIHVRDTSSGGWSGVAVKHGSNNTLYVGQAQSSTSDIIWTKQISETDVGTALGKIPKVGEYGIGLRKDLGTVDLNTLKGKAKGGRYYQNSTSLATTDRNYPHEEAGMLDVDTLGDNITIQTYTTYNSNYVYHRRFYNNVWVTGWERQVRKSDISDADDNTGTASQGKVASPTAVKKAKDAADGAQEDITNHTNTDVGKHGSNQITHTRPTGVPSTISATVKGVLNHIAGKVITHLKGDTSDVHTSDQIKHGTNSDVATTLNEKFDKSDLSDEVTSDNSDIPASSNAVFSAIRYMVDTEITHRTLPLLKDGRYYRFENLHKGNTRIRFMIPRSTYYFNMHTSTLIAITINNSFKYGFKCIDCEWVPGVRNMDEESPDYNPDGYNQYNQLSGLTVTHACIELTFRSTGPAPRICIDDEGWTSLASTQDYPNEDHPQGVTRNGVLQYLSGPGRIKW